MIHAFISQPPWEFERHRRGSIRWYPFDTLLANGTNSAGSAATLTVPQVDLSTGNATATPQSRSREMVEKGNPLWIGADGLDYWSRPMKLTVFVSPGVSNSVPVGSFMDMALFMIAPGLPPWSTTPGIPYVILRYRREGLLAPTDERFELITAVGDGVTPQQLTRLTQAPHSPISPGGMKTQRWEIIYMPGQYVSAYIDGQIGATNTIVPNPATAVVATSNMAGVGAYLEAGNAGDNCRAQFHSMMLENYRP